MGTEESYRFKEIDWEPEEVRYRKRGTYQEQHRRGDGHQMRLHLLVRQGLMSLYGQSAYLSKIKG